MLSSGGTIALRTQLNKALMAENFLKAITITMDRTFKPKIAEVITGTTAGSLAIVFAGRALKVDGGSTFDANQGKVVMTPNLQEKVIEFQSLKGITEEKGRLGYMTLKALSGAPSRMLLYNSCTNLSTGVITRQRRFSCQ